MASNAIAGVGTRFQRWNGTIWQDIAEISSIGGYGMDTDVLEVTTLDTEGTFREFVPGFSQGTVVSLSMNFTRLTYMLMRNDFISKSVLRYRILLPDDDEGDSSGALSMLAFNGFVKHVELGFVTDDKITSAVEIQMTGAVEGAIQDDDEEEEEIILNEPYLVISPDGDDITGDGTLETPYFSLLKAWSDVAAGTTIYMRGGTYKFTVPQILTGKNGTISSRIYVRPYPNEKPILTIDNSITYPSYPIALVRLTASYTSWEKLEITGFTQRGTGICSGFTTFNGSNNSFNRFNVHHNGHGMLVMNTPGTLVEYSDFHHNYDPATAIAYGDADGLEFNGCDPTDTPSTVRKCRFWANSDDGIDLWECKNHVTIDGCWAWNNGYREDGVTKGGDGNGIKLGRLDNSDDHVALHLRTVTNNLSFNNYLAGINNNVTKCVIHLFNNTTFGNPHGYFLWGFNDSACLIYNNISYGNDNNGNFDANHDVLTNTFQRNGTNNPAFTVTDGDFVSVVPLGVDGARGPNGELPVITFLHLAPTSDLIDVGTLTGLPYNGIAPDLGAFEY